MGMSADAALVYGIDLGGSEDWGYGRFEGFEAPEWLEDGGYFEDAVVKALGLPNPEYPNHLNARGLSDAERRTHPDYKRWSDQLGVNRKAVKELGVTMHDYGYSDGFSSYVLAITESIVRSPSYGSVRVDLENSPFTESWDHDWDGKLERVAALLDLELLDDMTPGWYLTASYG